MRATDKSSTRLFVADQPSLRIVVSPYRPVTYTTLGEAQKSLGVPAVAITPKALPRLYVTR